MKELSQKELEELPEVFDTALEMHDEDGPWSFTDSDGISWWIGISTEGIFSKQKMTAQYGWC